MKIGDRVQISSCSDEYRGRFCNCTGSVGYTSGLCKNKIGIRIDGIPNTASKYGVFWFSKRSLKYINGESEEKYHERFYGTSGGLSCGRCNL